MNLKLTFFAMILAGLSFTIGWMRADQNSSKLVQQEDEWESLAIANIDQQTFKKVAVNLHATDIFPISRAAARKLEEQENTNEVQGVAGVPNFPPIIGASVLNSVPHIHLLLPDKTMIKAKSGDQLENGWQLISVDLQRVSAVYDGEEHEFFVTNYDVKDEDEEK